MLTSNWRKFRRGWSLNLSRWHHKLMKVSYFEDYIKSRPFLKILKEAPLGNMFIFMYNDFQQLFCKILWENWPVVKLVNANELFLFQSPYYMLDCIWYKNQIICKLFIIIKHSSLKKRFILQLDKVLFSCHTCDSIFTCICCKPDT